MSCKSCNRNNPINRISNIVEGYSNLIFKDDKVETLALKRMLECLSCDNKNILLKIGDKTIYGCKSCNCPIDAKIRVEDEVCPLGKW